MALHGSASANLSPILFKGNNRSLGVNVIIHQDESGSMNDVIAFYSNGTFIGELQNALIAEKIGNDLTRYPNLYAYFGGYSRNPSTPFTISNSNGTLAISQAFMRGEATSAATIANWTTTKYFSNSTSHVVDICTDVVGTTTGGRLNSDVTQNTEDVHGNLWSIFTTPNAISTGTAGRFGSVIGSNVRKGSTTIVITNSDEQGGAPTDMINNQVVVGLSQIVPSTFITVIDESDVSNSTIDSSWNSFRLRYPNSRFYLLDPGGGGLYTPQAFRNNPLAFGPITVNRDNGSTGSRSDWFNICNLSSLPRGSIVSLMIDNSGSMNSDTVRASINLLVQNCNNAGLELVQGTFGDENWAQSQNKDFVEYGERTINGSTGEMVFRGYRVIALSSYTSTDGYDGVLFYGSTSTQPFGYVKFTSNTTYTITRLTTAPNWTRGTSQLHDTLTLARETRGGLFKIRNIFTTGVDRRVAFSKCLAEFIADTV